ncbi:MAG: hypothetical protein GY803_06470, partial [Chloroflexi bacterium]|nr:hypothetical protein [Chloroflexota bacterium]
TTRPFPTNGRSQASYLEQKDGRPPLINYSIDATTRPSPHKRPSHKAGYSKCYAIMSDKNKKPLLSILA